MSLRPDDLRCTDVTYQPQLERAAPGCLEKITVIAEPVVSHDLNTSGGIDLTEPKKTRPKQLLVIEEVLRPGVELHEAYKRMKQAAKEEQEEVKKCIQSKSKHPGNI
ncbi:hypothetical protein AAG570_003188 [Ranatra chinensis]|uniref:Uncharacterized protein n=1 Tax=Ranatra chinensis TaxID=642074 RepID=A0ABD0YIF3_9HEMI